MGVRKQASGKIPPGFEANRGWVLVDCLVGMIVVVTAFTPALLCLSTLAAIYNGEKAAADARDNAQAAVSVIGRLVRSAGCNPKGIAMQALRFQGSTELSLESDRSGDPAGLPDGFLDDPFEQVRIEWDASTRQISLASGAGSRQPLAIGISHLEMQGLDRLGANTSLESEVVYVQLQIRSEGQSNPLFPTMASDTSMTVRIPILSRLEIVP